MRIITGLVLVLYALVCMAVMIAETFRRGQASSVRSYRIASVPIVVVGVAFGMLGIVGELIMEVIERGERWAHRLDEQAR